MDPGFKGGNYHTTPRCYFRSHAHRLRYAPAYMHVDLPAPLQVDHCFCKHYHSHLLHGLDIHGAFAFIFDWHKSFAQRKPPPGILSDQRQLSPHRKSGNGHGREGTRCRQRPRAGKARPRSFALCTIPRFCPARLYKNRST